uniref:Uncharacterized protein n=1 Tax=Lotharella globosa TaxID=91324 RepID=A0A7S3ZD49_9EUKA
MGSSRISRFLYAVSRGDEATAIKLYTEDDRLAQSLRLSEIPEKSKRKSSPLHDICEWALADLLELVLPMGDNGHRVEGKEGRFKVQMVSVPHGKLPGQTFMVDVEGKQKMRVTVPPGATGGTRLQVAFEAFGGGTQSMTGQKIQPMLRNGHNKNALELLLMKANRFSQRCPCSAYTTHSFQWTLSCDNAQ